MEKKESETAEFRSAVAKAKRQRNTYRYRTAREAFLTKNPLCAECERHGLTVAAEELDHIVPVAQRPDLFWDRKNWQGLCKPCHELKTAAENANRRFKWKSPLEREYDRFVDELILHSA